MVVFTDTSIVLLDLIPSGNAKVDTAFADKCRDIGGGEEDEGYWEVLNESDVEAVLATELDVGALEEVERSVVETTLCITRLATRLLWVRACLSHTHSWGRQRAGGLRDCRRCNISDSASTIKRGMRRSWSEQLFRSPHGGMRTNLLTKSMAGN